MQNRLVGKGADKKSHCALFLRKSGIEKKEVSAGERAAYKALLKNSRPGLVMTGYPAAQAAAFLAKENSKQLLTVFPPFLVEEAGNPFSASPEMIWEALEETVSLQDENVPPLLFPLGEYGIFGTLWDVGETLFCGLSVYLEKIAMKQSIVEICNFFDINPYQLPSEGCYLLVCSDPFRAAELLGQADIPACVIGQITPPPGRVVLNRGETRHLNIPRPEDLQDYRDLQNQ
ncbi:MAG: hypothetical protein K5739_09910 [Lachnospiraceae bacterium]|nr:hypothetical protein [Lachnospiraceae bacterium]